MDRVVVDSATMRGPGKLAAYLILCAYCPGGRRGRQIQRVKIMKKHNRVGEYQEGDLIWALYQGEDGCDKLEGEVTALYPDHQKIQVHIYDNGSAEVVWADDVEPRHSGYYLWSNKQVWDRGNKS